MEQEQPNRNSPIWLQIMMLLTSLTVIVVMVFGPTLEPKLRMLVISFIGILVLVSFFQLFKRPLSSWYSRLQLNILCRKHQREFETHAIRFLESLEGNTEDQLSYYHQARRLFLDHVFSEPPLNLSSHPFFNQSIFHRLKSLATLQKDYLRILPKTPEVFRFKIDYFDAFIFAYEDIFVYPLLTLAQANAEFVPKEFRSNLEHALEEYVSIVRTYRTWRQDLPEKLKDWVRYYDFKTPKKIVWNK